MKVLVDTFNGALRRIPLSVVYCVGLLPAPYLLYLGVTGGLGVEPVKALEHRFGEIALQLLVAGLCVTPLRRYLGINLLRFRRALGLLCFSYVSFHLLVWVVLDVQILAQIWADIVKRPYITVGMAAFLAMIPLALTSNNWSLRKLGPNWPRLHRLTYLAALLAAVHFVWLSRGFQWEPLIYLGLIVGLLTLRTPKRQKIRPA